MCTRNAGSVGHLGIVNCGLSGEIIQLDLEDNEEENGLPERWAMDFVCGSNHECMCGGIIQQTFGTVIVLLHYEWEGSQ